MYGDFKAGYQIGIRGGMGINIKFLDQPKALEGLLTVIGYQRVDGRVRRSEAIQGISTAAAPTG
jgi:HK97 family phage major capsid protein